jgi:glycerol-3-phosphate acyltransferase PlsY
MPWLDIALGYFLGSTPTAYIAGHILKGVDIRQLGDTNMGAANVFRMALPGLVGFTHFIRTRRQVIRQA